MAFVVFAGQSNMGGAYMDASTLSAAWTPDSLTRIWDPAAKAWVQMQPGVNTGFGQMPNAWGPEVAFAMAFRAAFPDEPLYLVKATHGGTPLEPDTGPWQFDWSPDSTDEHFDRTAAMIAEASAALGGLKPEALFWGQGETDATNPGPAAAYFQNFQEFLAAARAEWLSDPAAHVGFFRINPNGAYSGAVRQAQADVDAIDPYARSFDTHLFPLQGDNLHFSAQSYDWIGQEFFHLLELWRSPPPPGEWRDGAAGDDTLMGAAGPDTLVGAAGLDFVRGGEGDDLLLGGEAFDDLHGNWGFDTLYGGEGGDWVVGGQGRDRLFGEGGHDVVYGNLADDLVDGGDGNDWVRGGQGNDVLFGGGGDDFLAGDRGDDLISGGWGADLFHVFGEAGRETILDFNRADGDRIQVMAGYTWSASQVGADTVVDLSGGARVVLVGVQLASLDPGWIFQA